MSESNPRIRTDLRVFMMIEILILAPTGIMLFFATDYAQTVWPWELTPFNARFIGGFYLGAMLAAAFIVVKPRWAPARVLTTLAYVFTLLVLLVSFVYLDRFDFDRPLTWPWFVLYVLIPVYTGYALWTHRRLRAAAAPTPRAISVVQTVSGVILGAYGLGLLIAPVALSAFWPWPVDEFHGRLYAAVPMAPALTALLLRRRATPADLLGAGATTFAASTWIILSVVITDATTGSVDWAAPATWLWVGAFAAMAALGLAMAASGRRAGRTTGVQLLG